MRLRQVMAADAAPLGELARLLAAELVSEVCSIYVMRPGEILELAATHGLNPAGGRPHPAAGRGGDCRIVCGDAGGAEPRRRAEPPGVRLSRGDRRGAVCLDGGGAGAPGRADGGRAGGAEPQSAAVFRGGGRRPGDGDDAAGRTAGGRRRGRQCRGGHRCHGSAGIQRVGTCRRHCGRSGAGAWRPSDGPPPAGRRSGGGAAAAVCGGRPDAARSR